MSLVYSFLNWCSWSEFSNQLKNQTCRCVYVLIPVLGKQRQVGLFEFEVSLVYTEIQTSHDYILSQKSIHQMETKPQNKSSVFEDKGHMA